MTETIEQRIAHDELVRLGLRCKICKGEVIVDLNEEEQTKRVGKEGYAFKCSICTAEFDTKVSNAIGFYLQWMKTIEGSGTEAFFCLRQEVPKQP